MKAPLKTLMLLLFIGVGSTAIAQKEGPSYKISESEWSEITDDYKIRATYKKTDFRYAIDTGKEVLGGTVTFKRTIYSSSDCSCILLIINYEKGEPFELIDYLFKYKKYYSRDGDKWRFESRKARVGYKRCQ